MPADVRDTFFIICHRVVPKIERGGFLTRDVLLALIALALLPVNG
jgi:hypothetical protein